MFAVTLLLFNFFVNLLDTIVSKSIIRNEERDAILKNSTVKQLLESDDLLVGISELSKVTGVSPRQIRYWEQKGYIESTGEKSGNRKFKLPMVVKVEIIKHFLDEGYTLTASVERAHQRQKNIHQAKLLVREVFKGIQQIDDRYTVIHLDDFIE